MTKFITQCECGNREFNAMESYTYKMAVQADGALSNIKSAPNGGIDSITCTSCDKEYSCEDFAEIIF